MALRFYSEHKSWSEDLTWKVEIWDSAHVSASTEFYVSAEGVNIEYRPATDNIFSPILASTVSFGMMVQNATHEALITDMAAGSEGRFTVAIYKNSSFYWAGVVNSPEISIEDQDYPYEFRITAVDGLALLRNYEYRQDGTSATKWDLRYTGIDNLVDIILRCLKKVPHIATHFSSATKFLVTAINWYSDTHAASPVSSTYDPFYYTEIDNRFSVTGQSSGNAKFLNCYEVLSHILTAFNARIALYDGYFLAEQIEHRAYAIGSNDNYSRYYAYDGTGPTANTLSGSQDVGGGELIKKLSAGSYTFMPAAKSVRAKQNINSLANLLSGYYFDSGAVETVTVEDIFGDGVNSYIRITGAIEWSFENIGVASPGTTPFIARYRIKLQLGSKYAKRDVTYDNYGNWTLSQATWENATSYIEIPVKLTIPVLNDTWTGQTPVDIMFPLDAAFSTGDLVTSIEFIEINYYILGAETLLDPSDYSLDWTYRDPYCAIIYSPKKVKTLGLTAGAINPKSATYEVIGSTSNAETIEVETILGDKIGTVLNQWGGFLFDNAGTYSYTQLWAPRNGTRNRTIAQLLAKRMIDFLYYPKRVYRGTIVGSDLVVQVPINDQTTGETYILQNGRYNTERDELTGEWVDITYQTPELTYAPVEYDTGDYEKTTASGGGSSGGGGSVDNGGNGNGNGSGGNGIYGGSGTVAAGTVATMSGDFSLANTSASAGEAFQVTIDDGSSSNVIKAEAGQGITLQSTGDTIFIEGETALSDVITSASLGTDQNDYAGFDGANVGRLTASTAVNITGIASGSIGRLLALHNVGSNPITLVNTSGSSTAANRFDIGEDYTIRAKHGVVLQYDSTDSRWRIIAADRLGRFTEAYTTSTATTASITATSPATNVGVAVVPKGTGALTAQVPDGTSAGGNARGQYAVDWQTLRTNASDVASGNYSTIPGGRRCTASGQYSFATGFRGEASGDGSVAFGGSGLFSAGATASGANSFAFGPGSTATSTGSLGFMADATADSAIAFGRNADKHSMFATIPVSFLKWGNQLTLGTSTYELTLDGSSLKASIPSGERWQFEVCVSATTAVVGDGTGTTNHQYFASYVGVIRNVGGTTSLLGTVDALMAAKADATISDASFAITADDTNDYLKIVFTPPSTAGSSSQYSVGASAKLFIF